MAKIIIILLLAGGLGVLLGKLQGGMQPETEERFYLVADESSPSLPASPSSAPSKPASPSAVAETSGASNPSSAAIVEFPEGTLFKFETMKHGTTMSHKFPIRNAGTAPLKLEKAGSTCKCTVGELDKNVIMPGETTMINLEWRAVSVVAKFGQSATFRTNASEMPEFKLEVQGAVIDSFVLDPDSINLGSFASDVGTSREFSIYCYAEGVDLERLEWSNPDKSQYFKISQTPFSPAESEGHTKALKAYKVKVDVLPGLPVGSIGGSVQLFTNQGEEVDRLQVTVNGTAVSELSLIGGSAFKPDSNILTIGNLTSKDEFSTKLWLVLRGQGHESIEVAIDQKVAKESLKVSLGDRKVEANRTLIPINFDVPKGAPEAYYPGIGKGTFAEVVVKTTSGRAVELPIFVKLIITK